jgi:hypothetical protein
MKLRLRSELRANAVGGSTDRYAGPASAPFEKGGDRAQRDGGFALDSRAKSKSPSVPLFQRGTKNRLLFDVTAKDKT